ncbi:16S rRNA (cytosine(967)-C(5))-methyltransferase RsmB [Ideonella sp. A 288]|uniref:16S rRNA (cytosine(967)-C(5))-methyltransferase RsmB n=1 Tax=Ideonella sp. A 288 TaxID=1962181 RepID=UPI000B4B3D85|nr:16S rRNA (cytosine(967)-C(5))-methyltransferase RsmB [Ideonella sp. A 288]
MTLPSPPLARLLDQTADAVAAVHAGRSLTELLARCPPDLRAGTQALAFHVLRWWGGAQAVRALVAPKPPPPRVDALLVSALALAWPGSDPPYAEHTLVDQAVAAARHRTPAAANFINAVLRRFLRERDALVAAASRQPEAAYQHPAWWIERVRRDWPTQWTALLQAANQHPPMVLRVNARRGTADAYVQRLAAAGRPARVVGAHAVWLERPCPVTELPGFAEGDVSVQDLAAQRAAPLLLGDGLPPGAHVLDACAAPGGKTAHLLELAELDLLALDSDGQRLVRVQDTLTRLHLQARLQAADASQPSRWWDGRPFDAILLDAPCSASGIVRRHPDVRWLRRPDDIAALARQQAALLDALWPLLAPGGRLVYATCSIFRAEGQDQIDAFLQRHAADKPRLDPTSPGHLPGLPDNPPAASQAPQATGDGFFYALLRKPEHL